MKSFKTLALIVALSAGAFTAPVFAIKVCNSDMSCMSPNGPSLDGRDEATAVGLQPVDVELQSGFKAPSIKTCNPDNSCQSPNGPSFDGMADEVRSTTTPLSIKVCNQDGSCQSPNGPSLDGRDEATPIGLQPVDVELQSGFKAPSIKTCNADASCQSPNGPSVSGQADSKLGVVIIAIDMPE